MADDDDEKGMSFSMDGDFEGGNWVGGEFFYGMKLFTTKCCFCSHVYFLFSHFYRIRKKKKEVNQR
jgi:hypothetical protein